MTGDKQMEAKNIAFYLPQTDNMKNLFDVSIIIVNYNTKELVRNCLESIFEHTKNISFEVIVSDNGSKDGSIEMIKAEFPQVILIENSENLGFGAANNRGLKIAKGKYVFYLNSDTVLLNNAVKIFFEYFEKNGEREKIGALGCNLTDKNFTTTHSFASFPNPKSILFFYAMRNIKFDIKRLLHFFNFDYTKYKKKLVYQEYFGKVDYITGADLFLLNNDRAEFDERYFLYSEEVQLEYNLAKKGLNRLIIDGPKIMHLQGMSDETFDEDLLKYTTFGKIQMDISNVKFIKYNFSAIAAEACKILILGFWHKKINRERTKIYWKELRTI